MSFKNIPDQNRVKKILQGAMQNKRVANAYLFVCQDGALAHCFALAFAKTLNCERDGTDSCGECLPCRKISKGIHPDVILISPDGERIKIDQIRELRKFVRYGPSEGKWKVVIVAGADKMKVEAANSFLKALEEPPPQVTFILLASHKEGIPKTLISRCQKITFGEAETPLQPGNESDDIFLGMVDSISKRKIVEILDQSYRLSQNGDDIENVLNRLLLMQREKAVKASSNEHSDRIKIVLNALKSLKKNANKRLALDNMLLKLKEIKNVEKVSH